MRSTKSSDRILSLFSRVRFWILGWSAADRRLRLELQSAVLAPISPRTREDLAEEIDGLHRQVEALKNEITKLKDTREQTAQTIAR